MLRFSGILFWLGVLLMSIVVVLTLNNNAISELIVGLIFSPERDFLAITSIIGTVLLGIGLTLRRRKGHALPNWRLVFLGLSCITGIVVSFSALKPGFSTTDVSYDSQGAGMQATLYLPVSTNPAPAIVIVPGSAPFKRQFYDVYASRLARHGYAVLLADKRGAGESGGEFESNNNSSFENLNLLAKDAVAGVKFLANHSSIQSQRIGLFGLSQAGWVSALAASETSRIRFLVMVTAPAVSVGEEGTWSDLRGDDRENPIAGFTAAREKISKTEPFGFDPGGYLAALTIPSLWLFGDIDNSIPSHKSISILESLSRENVATKLYANYGHLLIGKGNGKIFDIAPESWKDITDWLDSNQVDLES